jgi:cob(I)alamin adenosyltransferase
VSDAENTETNETPPSENPIPDGGGRASSLVLVNTGDGKGKSSAAFGVMVRGLAMEWNVCVVQFVKSGDWKVGEEKLGRQLGVDWHSVGEGFTWDSDNLDHDKAIAAAGWTEAAKLINAGDHKLVILDEITYLMNWGWVDSDAVIETIRNRPDHVNIVATGRDAPDALIDVADTVTEMVKVKHAYDTGILAKRGIDY